MTVLQVQSLPVLANQHRQISFLPFSFLLHVYIFMSGLSLLHVFGRLC